MWVRFIHSISLLSENNVQEELFDQILRGKLEFPSPDWDAISLPAKVPLTHTNKLLSAFLTPPQ